MIAELSRAGKVVATLDDSGDWQSDDPNLVLYLEALYNPGKPPWVGPAMGAMGEAAARGAALALSCDVVVSPVVEPPEGLVM